FHALSWLHYEYLQQGRFAKARDTMREVERAIAGGSPAEAGHYRNPGDRNPGDRIPGSSRSDHSGRDSSVGACFNRTGRDSSVASGFSRTVRDSSVVSGFSRIVRDSSVVSGFSRTVENAHQHIESEIGKGFNPVSLKSELASMKARLVVESGDWALMKGQGSFDNIDELFALGAASVKLGDAGRAEAAIEHLRTAAKAE